jgi:hypothetical protein
MGHCLALPMMLGFLFGSLTWLLVVERSSDLLHFNLTFF